MKNDVWTGILMKNETFCRVLRINKRLGYFIIT